MLTSFNPRAGLKALLIQCCAFAAAAAGASPLAPEQVSALAALRDVSQGAIHSKEIRHGQAI